jgi:hypothetical protein
MVNGNGEIASQNPANLAHGPSAWRRRIAAAGLTFAVMAGGACANGNGAERASEGTNTTIEAGDENDEQATTTTIVDQLDNGVVGDGSDAAIAADVPETRCGGTGVVSSMEAPFDGGGFMDLLRDPANHDLAVADETFWKDVMGAEAFKHFANRALRNPLTADDEPLDHMSDEYSRFLGALVAVNPDAVPDAVVNNSYCPDLDDDGIGDKIERFDQRAIRNGETTLTSGILTPEDFEKLKELVKADGKDIENLLYFPITIDGEEFVAVAVKLDACLNNILRAQPTEAPQKEEEKVEEREEEEQPVSTTSTTVTPTTTTSTAPSTTTSSTAPAPTTSTTAPSTTTTSTTTTTAPSTTTTTTAPTTTSTTASTTTTSTTAPTTTSSTRPEVTVPAPEPIQGPGSGGEADQDNDPDNNVTTSTTARPATTQPPATTPATTAPRPATTEAPIPAPTSTPTTAPEGESGINPEDLAVIANPREGTPLRELGGAALVLALSFIAENRRRKAIQGNRN